MICGKSPGIAHSLIISIVISEFHQGTPSSAFHTEYAIAAFFLEGSLGKRDMSDVSSFCCYRILDPRVYFTIAPLGCVSHY